MKINKITGSNFLILKEVELEPDSKLNVLAGSNRSGKTSFLKMVQAGLLGTTDPNVIKVGADKAEIMIDMDGIKVQRVITAKGQRVKVTNTEGDIKANPQKFLNSLLGNFSFDPLAFIQMQKPERKKYLVELFNPKVKEEQLTDIIEPELMDRIRPNFDKVDGLTILKNLEDLYYARRTDVNKQLKQKEGAYQEAIPLGYKPPEVEVNVDDLIARLKLVEAQRDTAKNIEVQNENATKARARIEAKIKEFNGILEEVNEEAIGKIPECEEAIASYEEEIRILQESLAHVRTTHEVALQHLSVKNDALKAIEEQTKSLDDFPLLPVPDITDIEGQVVELDAAILEAKHKEALRDKYLKAQGIKAEVDTLVAQSKRLTNIIDKLRKDIPAQIIKDAQIPIPEMRIDGDNIMIGERSLDNMSTSEQITVALQMVRELNKDAKLKVLFLDRAESLDDETFEEFRKQIAGDDFTYFLTMVYGGKVKENGDPENKDIIPEGALWVKDGTMTPVVKDLEMLLENGEVKA